MLSSQKKAIRIILAAAFIIAGGIFALQANALEVDKIINVNVSVATTTTPPSGGGGGGGDLPPVISGVIATSSFTSITVVWSASDDHGITNVTFEYGLSPSYGNSGAVAGNYQSVITNLATDTLYYYKISVSDTVPQLVAYTGSIRTLAYQADITPPDISNISVVPGVTTATISWTTNEAADSQINYGKTFSYGDTVTGAALVTSHSMPLSNLLPNNSYHFRIISMDGSANSTSTVDLIFTTLKDNIPPPDVSNFSLATTSNSFVLHWTNPILVSVPDFVGVKILRKIGSSSAHINDGTLVYTGAGETFTDTSAAVGPTYYYTIFSYDTSDNYSPGNYKSGKLVAPPLPTPEICNNHIDDDNNGKTDCADPACSAYPLCLPPPQIEICNNGIDDNGNGKVDCADPACVSASNCVQPPEEKPPEGAKTPEVCNNGVDDDKNGFVDCADPACAQFIDCALKPPPVTVPAFAHINLSDISFLAANRTLRLTPVGDMVSSLAGTQITVMLPGNLLMAIPKGMTLRVGVDSHQFVYNTASQEYYADLSMPNGITPAYLEIDYGAGQMDSTAFRFSGLQKGNVAGDKGALSGAKVVLYDTKGNKAATENFGQNNPLTTGADGAYGWLVPNGEYFLTAEKDDFFTNTSQKFTVRNNIVNQNISLKIKPPPLAELISPTGTIAENITRVFDFGLQNIQALRENPVVQKAAQNIFAPTAIAVVAAGAIPLISWLDIIPFLRLLFLQPLMLVGRRKRANWGMVYNALSKQPVDLAIVRLLNLENNRVVQSRVTDLQGHYLFMVDPGKYKIEVQKHGFVFPSQLLRGYKNDGKKTDIYHGEEVDVKEMNASITANIPLDPVGAQKKPSRLIWERFWRSVQVGLSWAGLIVTGVSYYITTKWYIGVLLVIHLVLFLVFRRLAKPAKGKGWGIVYGADTKKPVGRVVARLFNSQFNKLVATQVTDAKGRYFFLAGDDKFYISYEHKEYQPDKSDTIDLSGKESEAIGVDKELKKQ
jgi:hypothetical protein